MFSKLNGIVGCGHTHSIKSKKTVDELLCIYHLHNLNRHKIYYMFWGINYQSTDGVQITYRFQLNYQDLFQYFIRVH